MHVLRGMGADYPVQDFKISSNDIGEQGVVDMLEFFSQKAPGALATAVAAAVASETTTPTSSPRTSPTSPFRGCTSIPGPIPGSISGPTPGPTPGPPSSLQIASLPPLSPPPPPRSNRRSRSSRPSASSSALVFPLLTALDVSFNHLSPSISATLTDALFRRPLLKNLNLSHNNISAGGVEVRRGQERRETN